SRGSFRPAPDLTSVGVNEQTFSRRLRWLNPALTVVNWPGARLPLSPPLAHPAGIDSRGNRHRVVAVRQLHVKHHQTAPAEAGLAAEQIKLPHAAKALAHALLEFVPMTLKALVPT